MAHSQSDKVLLDKIWQSSRSAVAKNLLVSAGGGELIPVPYLSKADDFGLFSVFVKSKSGNLGQKIKHTLAPTYNVIGHISQVIQLEKTDLDRLLESAKPYVEDLATLSRKWENDMDFGSKSVHLTVNGLSKYLVPLNMTEGDLYFNENIPDLASAKSVYIVTDVLKADDVTAVVTGDDDSLAKLHVQSIPVAFGYSKFRLGPGGLVAEQMTTKPSLDAKWDVVIDRLSGHLNVLCD